MLFMVDYLTVGIFKKSEKVHIELFRFLARSTGFEPAALRVGVIRPTTHKALFHAVFGDIAQNTRQIIKARKPLVRLHLCRFFQFLKIVVKQ